MHHLDIQTVGMYTLRLADKHAGAHTNTQPRIQSLRRAYQHSDAHTNTQTRTQTLRHMCLSVCTHKHADTHTIIQTRTQTRRNAYIGTSMCVITLKQTTISGIMSARDNVYWNRI